MYSYLRIIITNHTITNMKTVFVSLLMALVILSSCSSDELSRKERIALRDQYLQENYVKPEHAKAWAQSRIYFQPISETGASNAANPFSDDKIELGRMLYFDPRLSVNNEQSCNSCHNLETFGVDNLSTSPGALKESGSRNSPTVLNAAFHTAQFWDGRSPDVEDQAKGPILNPIEMGIPSEEYLEEKLRAIPEYVKQFEIAFPDESEPLTYDNIANAIAAFERKLVTTSKFDDFLAGNPNALNEQEIRGLGLFIDKGCTSCHIGPGLGGSMFRVFGEKNENYWEYTGSESIDNGMFDVSGRESDRYKFKVPSLRNIEKTWPYFHDGSVESLEEAISIMAHTQLDNQLSESEMKDMIEFLKTLTADLPEDLKKEPKLPGME